MTTKTKTPANGHATAQDVAASVDLVIIRPALARRIQDRYDDVRAAEEAARDAQRALDDMIALAKEIEEPPAGWEPARLQDGGLAFVPPRAAPPRPATPTE